MVKKNAPDDSFGRAMAGPGENARLRAENVRLQKTIDELKHRRPSTTEEDMRAEVSKLRIQLHALSNQDNTRAKLTQEISVLKIQLQERTQELKEHQNHSQREAFKQQKAAIKEFTDRVQSELEKENRALQTRAAGRGTDQGDQRVHGDPRWRTEGDHAPEDHHPGHRSGATGRRSTRVSWDQRTGRARVARSRTNGKGGDRRRVRASGQVGSVDETLEPLRPRSNNGA